MSWRKKMSYIGTICENRLGLCKLPDEKELKIKGRGACNCSLLKAEWQHNSCQMVWQKCDSPFKQGRCVTNDTCEEMGDDERTYVCGVPRNNIRIQKGHGRCRFAWQNDLQLQICHSFEALLLVSILAYTENGRSKRMVSAMQALQAKWRECQLKSIWVSYPLVLSL